MRIKIIAPPVIDVSGLMRSPQYDVACLFGDLKKEYKDQVDLYDFRFFFYDDFYKEKRADSSFLVADFRSHQKIVDIIQGKEIDLIFEERINSLYSLFREYLDETKYLIIPFTIYQQFTLEYFLSALYFAFFVKKRFPHICILAYGNYSGQYAKDIIQNFSFIEASSLRADRKALIKYIATREQGHTIPILNCLSQDTDITQLIEKEPQFDFDILPDYSTFDRQPYRHRGSELVLGYQLGNGCKNTCFYCYNSHKGGITYTKQVEKIVADLKELKEQYKTRLFHFCDDEINYSNTFLYEFGVALRDAKIDIYWTALIIPHDLSHELLQLLYDAGCRQLRFGIESGSQKILDTIGKGTSLDEMSHILKTTKKVGIHTYASFIVDIPQEENRDITQTLEFIYKNKKYLDNIVICAYRAHLGNYDKRYFDYLMGKSEYSFFRGKRLSRNKVFLRQFCDKLGKLDIDIIDFMKSLDVSN